MSEVKEELGLFAVRNVSCTTLACESHACRNTMEVLGKDEKPPFLVKYTVFPKTFPAQSQTVVNVQSYLRRAAKPRCSVRAFGCQGPQDVLYSSSAGPGLTWQTANPRLQTLRWCPACSIALGTLWGNSSFVFNLSLVPLVWDIDQKAQKNVMWAINCLFERINIAALSLQGLGGFI